MEEMWIAREQNGTLVLFFREKPEKKRSQWNNQIDSWIEIDSHLFPEVKWSDKEPTRVSITIKK